MKEPKKCEEVETGSVETWSAQNGADIQIRMNTVYKPDIKKEVEPWELEFSKTFTFGGYCVNGDRYVAIRINGDKNDAKAPDKLKDFIKSLLQEERSRVVRDVRDWVYTYEDDALFVAEWIDAYAKANGITLEDTK